MKHKYLILAILMMFLGSCNQTPEPTSYPAPGTQYPYPGMDTSASGGSAPYPGPDSSNPGEATTYPGPDTPVSSDGSITPNPYPDPLQPIAGEDTMLRGNVFIDTSDILTLESMPPQYTLHIVGNLPTSCHKLRASLSQPDEQNQVKVEVYSLVNPDEVCAQVLSPFATNIPLGSYETGKYLVFINGEKIGEIEAP
jgi:hypothetical protein